MTDTPPNIVFILADDLGYADVSCNGRRDYLTPNIDRLASEGVRFTQACANSPVCSATRTALMTGRYQYRLPVGLEEPINADSPTTAGLPPEHPSLRLCCAKPAMRRRSSASGILARHRTTGRSKAAMSCSMA